MSTDEPSTPPPALPKSQKEWRFKPLYCATEWSESYRPGGFHPVNIGDEFKDSRYKVLRKLGYGSFSTVWLVCDNDNGGYYALKVLKAGDNQQGPNELKVHQLLGESPTDGASDSIVRLLDSFEHQGPNGTHLCMILEAMGPSAASMLDYLPFNLPLHLRRTYPFWMTKRILHQTLVGLRTLHSKGLAHGDLQPGNILFAIRDLKSAAIEELRQDAEKETMFGPLKRTDGKQDRWAPQYLAKNLPLAKYADTGPSLQVKLSDMGAAYEISNPPESYTTPRGLRAPELIVGEKLGETADIWSFGCLVYEFVTGWPLFAVMFLGGSHASEADHDHLLQLTRLLGPPPEELSENWSRSSVRFGAADREPIDSDDSSDDELDYDVGPDDELDYDKCPEDELDVGDGDDELGIDEGRDGELGVDEGFDNRIGSSRGARPVPQSLEEAFEMNKPRDLSDEDAHETVALVRSILQYEPAKRPSIETLLRNPWFSHK